MAQMGSLHIYLENCPFYCSYAYTNTSSLSEAIKGSSRLEEGFSCFYFQEGCMYLSSQLQTNFPNMRPM